MLPMMNAYGTTRKGEKARAMSPQFLKVMDVCSRPGNGICRNKWRLSESNFVTYGHPTTPPRPNFWIIPSGKVIRVNEASRDCLLTEVLNCRSGDGGQAGRTRSYNR